MDMTTIIILFAVVVIAAVVLKKRKPADPGTGDFQGSGRVRENDTTQER